MKVSFGNRGAVSGMVWIAIVLIIAVAILLIWVKPLDWTRGTLGDLTSINLCEQTGGTCYATNDCGGHTIKGFRDKGFQGQCSKGLSYCCFLDYTDFVDGSMYLYLGTEPKSTFKLTHKNPGASSPSLTGQYMEYEAVVEINRQYANAETAIPKNAGFQLAYHAGSDAEFCKVVLSEGSKTLYTSEVSACRSITEDQGFVEFFPTSYTHYWFQLQNKETYNCGKKKQDRCTISIVVLGGPDVDNLVPIGEPFYIVLSGEEA